MKQNFSPTVINLGGSIVAPDDINVEYLKQLRQFLLPYVHNGHKFVIVVGGGHVARVYQKAAADIVSTISNDDKDWLGIHATRINAHLLRTIFVDVCYPVVLDDPYKEISDEDLEKYGLFIGSGVRPGHSTDFCTVQLAHRFGVSHFLTATVVPFVYDKDYKKYPDAKIIYDLSWEDYSKIIEDQWTPGMKVPVDPVAAKEAQEHGMSCYLLQGTHLDNVKKYLNNETYQGSVIHP